MNNIPGYTKQHEHKFGEIDGRRTCSICGTTLYKHVLPGGEVRWMTIPSNHEEAEEYLSNSPAVQRLAKCTVCKRILPDLGFNENGVCADCQH